MASRLLQRISNFLARLPGLPILVAIGLVVLNFILLVLPDWPVIGWLAEKQLLLHLGVIVGLLGVLLGRAL
jgi:hypothetical protein